MSRTEAAPAPEEHPARLFAALGDSTRISLIGELADGTPRSMAEIGDRRPISRQAVAKHLEVLLKAGLVRRTRVGREARFTVAPDAIRTARDWLDAVGAQWDGTLDRLKEFVEDGS